MTIFNRLKVKARDKQSIYMFPGDSIVLSYTDIAGKRHEVLRETVTEARTITESVVVEGEFEGKPAIGGLFLGDKQ